MLRLKNPAFAVAFIAIALAVSASAQEQRGDLIEQANDVPTNSVEIYLFAHQLYAYGKANNDILAVITAAGILRKVLVRPGNWFGTADSTPDSSGKVAKVVDPPTLDEVVATARKMVGQNHALLSFLDDIVASGSKGAVSGPQEAKKNIPGGKIVFYEIPFSTPHKAIVSLTIPTGVDASLTVKDEFEIEICSADKTIPASDGQQRLECKWTPAFQGKFTIYVANRGQSPFEYYMLTN